MPQLSHLMHVANEHLTLVSPSHHASRLAGSRAQPQRPVQVQGIREASHCARSCPEQPASQDQLPSLAQPCTREQDLVWDQTSWMWSQADCRAAQQLTGLGRATLHLEEPPTPNLHELEEARRKLERDLKFGEAVRALRDDIPNFFNVKRPQNYSIFRQDITLVDDFTPHFGLGKLRSDVHGKASYRRRLNALRTITALLVRVDQVQLHRFWQRTDGALAVRWTVHGQPRLPTAQYIAVDGISDYRFDSDGSIYQHTVSLIDYEGLRPKQRQAVPALTRMPSTTGS